ncbi:FAD-binding oxidoreductase [Umezawaea sp. NPDC059074]|uniref:FAD-binding oxidoreductase n=1 Tax=Umezawaea sp. NPDC059074 TaxID=3346716 RepID=UPI0036C5EE43
MKALRAVVPPECLVLPDSPEYERARLVYNRMHDVRPAALVRSLDPAVLHAAITAAEGVPLAVRGGGHHVGGFSTVRDGVVLDFSPFRAVEYDPATELVRVRPGARLGDVDTALAAHGRCLPSGTVSDTGLTGLTLGGGIGWLVAGHGLTCDHLHSAEVLLADGRVIRASAHGHTALFTALRGGGVGAFGVVLSLRYRTIPLPRITAGSVRFPLSEAANVLARLQVLLAEHTPTAVTFAPVLTGQGLSVDLCDSGAGPDVDRFRALGGDWSDVRERPYTEWQRELDHAFLPPMRGYWKSSQFPHLDVDPSLLVAAIAAAPSGRCSILVEYYNPDTLRAHAAGSAFPLRDSRTGVLFCARWPDPVDDTAHVRWARRWAAELGAGTGSYSNYAQDTDRVRPGFTPDTLAAFHALEAAYDPDRLFAVGHRAALVAVSRTRRNE